MVSQKIEPLLALAMEIPEQEREKSESLRSVDLSEEQNRLWTVVVRYNGNIDELKAYGIRVQILSGNYAILRLPKALLRQLNEFPQIIYVEIPKIMTDYKHMPPLTIMQNEILSEAVDGIRASCIPIFKEKYNLDGAGVLGVVLDSGIDYEHPAFRNADGSTRIIGIWDMTIDGNPPDGFVRGSYYSESMINEALSSENARERYNIVPSRDYSGHGTHVAGIMAGTIPGGTSGVATACKILVVKLGQSNYIEGITSVDLMEAAEFAYQTAVKLGMPAVINISIGTSLGAHNGTTLLETYLNDLSNLWRMSICVGTGNEADASGHIEVYTTREEIVEFEIGAYEQNFSMQIWKEYQAELRFFVQGPDQTEWVTINQGVAYQEFQLSDTKMYVYVGEPSPYSLMQELDVQLFANQKELYVRGGIWKIRIVGTGLAQIWMMDAANRNTSTKFLRPNPENTLTSPSTAYRVISVGGYDSRTDSYASFSGRGYTTGPVSVKPDLVAPAVNILSAEPGNRYGIRSGTSMATPYVSGTAILLMQWGIIKGNDSYLYGEKLKATLIRAVRRKNEAPTKTLGWGYLCAREL